MPVLVGMLAGILELGWMFPRWYAVVEAANTGARSGAVATSAGGIEASARAAALAELERYSISGGEVSVGIESGDPSLITVTVEVPHHALAGLMPMPRVLHGMAATTYEDAAETDDDDEDDDEEDDEEDDD